MSSAAAASGGAGRRNRQCVFLRPPVLVAAVVLPILAAAVEPAGSAASGSKDSGAVYYKVELGGTANGLRRRKLGVVYLAVYPDWAPVSAERFAELVTKEHFYDDTKFYQVRAESVRRPLCVWSTGHGCRLHIQVARAGSTLPLCAKPPLLSVPDLIKSHTTDLDMCRLQM